MRIPFCALILLFHSVAFATSQACLSTLSEINGSSNIVSYILFLAEKGYVAPETTAELLKGKVPEIDSFRFSSSLSETHKFSLRKGLTAAYKNATSKDAQVVQTKLSEKINLKEDQNKKVNTTKTETAGIWHKPFELESKSISRPVRSANYIEGRGYSLVQDTTDFSSVILHRGKNRIKLENIFIKSISILKNPAGFKEDEIIVGIAAWGELKIFNTQGQEIDHQKLSEENIKFIPPGINGFSNYAQFLYTTSFNSNGEVKILMNYYRNDSFNLYQDEGKLILYEPVKKMGKELDIHENYTRPITTSSGRVLAGRIIGKAKSSGMRKLLGLNKKESYFQIVDLESKEVINEIPWINGNYVPMVGQTNSFIYLPSLDKTSSILYNANDNKFSEVMLNSQGGTTKFLGSLKNDANEEIFYISAPHDRMVVKLNALTNELQKIPLGAIPREFILKQLKNEQHLLLAWTEKELIIYNSDFGLRKYQIPRYVSHFVRIEEENSTVNLHLIDQEKDSKYFESIYELSGTNH